MIFQNIQTNIISKQADLKGALKNKVPEGAIYFEGIVSNGDKNRNGYIIDEKAWFFEKSKYVKEFLNSGSVLYGHNSDKPIGRPLSFKQTDEGIKVSGYVFDDVYTNGAIGRGLVLGLSTGHFTHEGVFRNNKTGDEISEKDFSNRYWEEKELRNEYKEGLWDYAVKKAEIVEFSFVTVPSNRKSTLNGRDEILANKLSENLNKDLKEVKKIFFNTNNCMNETELKEALEVSKNEVAELKTNATEKDVEIKTLKEDSESKDSEINSLKETITEKEIVETSLNETIVEKNSTIKKMEEKQKEKILANANIDNIGKDKKGMNGFIAKYSK